MPKSIIFLCISNNQKLKKKKIFFNTINNSIKNMKHLGINLTEDVPDLHAENFKTRLRERRLQ